MWKKTSIVTSSRFKRRARLRIPPVLLFLSALGLTLMAAIVTVLIETRFFQAALYLLLGFLAFTILQGFYCGVVFSAKKTVFRFPPGIRLSIYPILTFFFGLCSLMSFKVSPFNTPIQVFPSLLSFISIFSIGFALYLFLFRYAPLNQWYRLLYFGGAILAILSLTAGTLSIFFIQA